MDDAEIWQLFQVALYADVDLEGTFPQARPHLAHYTSLDALEKILTTDEIWFSNPLFMNDFEEVTFGLLNGVSAFKTSDAIRAALKTDARHDAFVSHLDAYVDSYGRQYLIDTYVFCLSEQTPDNTDGILSMWRGYGGNGKGAAIVFDTSKLDPVDGSPLVFAKVTYSSPTQRFEWFRKIAHVFSTVLETHWIPDDKIGLVAAALFERVKLCALFTKHHGFREEHEWRVVYLKERDLGNRLAPRLSYHNGSKGIEPKLRFKVEPIGGLTAPDLSLGKLISAILLGPSMSSALAHRSVARMLELIGRPELIERLHASGIPFRSN